MSSYKFIIWQIIKGSEPTKPTNDSSKKEYFWSFDFFHFTKDMLNNKTANFLINLRQLIRKLRKKPFISDGKKRRKKRVLKGAFLKKEFWREHLPPHSSLNFSSWLYILFYKATPRIILGNKYPLDVRQKKLRITNLSYFLFTYQTLIKY